MEQPVASTRHSIVFLAIVAAVTLAGFAAQNRPVTGGGLVETHTDVIPVYLSVTVMNWLLVLFVWKGIRKRGAAFGSLIGERWRNGRDLLRDLGIAAIFWGVLVTTAWALHLALGEGHAKSVDVLLPRTPLEIGAWIVTSVSAGFCEEYVFRGYVQRQLRAVTQSSAGAVLGQGLLFGLMHAYQGWRAVLVITSMGLLFGALAAWRKTLTVGMVAHGWQDIWAGWLSPMLTGRVG